MKNIRDIDIFKDKKAVIFDMDGTLIDSMPDWYSKELWKLPTEQERDDYMTEKYDNEIEAKPFALEFCRELKAEGIPFCIATNTPFIMAQKLLSRLGFDGLYEFYIDCDEIGVPKSEPDIYDIATERLGVKKEEVVVFEDMLQSAQTAKKAGYCTVGVYDDINKNNMFEMKKLCDAYIYSYNIYLLQKNGY